MWVEPFFDVNYHIFERNEHRKEILSIFFQDVTLKIAMKMCLHCYGALKFVNKFQSKVEEAVKIMSKDEPTNDKSSEISRNVKKNNMDQSEQSIVEEKNKSRPFMCQICGNKFQSKGLVQQHIERHYTKKKQYKCKKCGKQFLVQPQFKNHRCKMFEWHTRFRYVLYNFLDVPLNIFILSMNSIFKTKKLRTTKINRNHVNKSKIVFIILSNWRSFTALFPEK